MAATLHVSLPTARAALGHHQEEKNWWVGRGEDRGADKHVRATSETRGGQKVGRLVGVRILYRRVSLEANCIVTDTHTWTANSCIHSRYVHDHHELPSLFLRIRADKNVAQCELNAIRCCLTHTANLEVFILSFFFCFIC